MCRNVRSIEWHQKTYHKISWDYPFKHTNMTTVHKRRREEGIRTKKLFWDNRFKLYFMFNIRFAKIFKFFKIAPKKGGSGTRIEIGCEMLILGEHIFNKLQASTCSCYTVLLKTPVPILYSENSNFKNRNYFRGDFLKVKCVGGLQLWSKLYTVI
jgi:hypothetical protein